MIAPSTVATGRVRWSGARRIVRSVFPPIDLFEDIADPEDWPLLIAAEQKTNPRLIESIGALELVPPARRVSGPGATWLMAPFTHVSRDRPSRFSDGGYGVLYLAQRFETALLETMHHHARFMRRTAEAPGLTSQFRELTMSLDATLHDLRVRAALFASALDADSYALSQPLGRALRDAGSDGIVYRVAGTRAASAPACSIPIWCATRHKAATSTIIGTARALISTATPAAVRSFASLEDNDRGERPCGSRTRWR